MHFHCLVSLVLVAVSSAATLPTNIQAQRVYTIQDLSTLLCLDGNTAGNVYMNVCNGGAFQKWIPSNSDNGTYKLVNVATQLVLDANGSGNVYAQYYDGATEWQIQLSSNGFSYSLQDIYNHRYLDSNAGKSVYTNPSDGGNYQQWVFTEFQSKIQAQLVYTIQDLSTQFCLECNTAGNVYMNDCNGGASQKWIPNNSDNGAYKLVNVATQLVLDANGSGNVYVQYYDGATEWQIQLNSNGYSNSLQDIYNHRYLDSNAGKSAFTNPSDGGNYQQWVFTEVPV
jgi:hypothetical protein